MSSYLKLVVISYLYFYLKGIVNTSKGWLIFVIIERRTFSLGFSKNSRLIKIVPILWRPISKAYHSQFLLLLFWSVASISFFFLFCSVCLNLVWLSWDDAQLVRGLLDATKGIFICSHQKVAKHYVTTSLRYQANLMVITINANDSGSHLTTIYLGR